MVARANIPLMFHSCLFLMLHCAGSSLAQEYRGRVQGIVTDTSDAVIGSARVSLRNVDTAVETVRETDPNGHYLFDMVLPGNYTVTVEREGFNRFVQENVVVQTRADVTVNARLAVGAVTQTVTVSESPVQVNFNTTSMELTVDTKLVQNLPLINRNPFMLAWLDPAVMPQDTLGQPYTYWSMSSMEIGGRHTTRTNELLLDGSPAQVNRKGSYAPPVDSVSEVTVMQNPVDAEYGHTSGGLIQVSTKSATNEVRGSLYYFGRHPKLNARANSMINSKNQTRLNSWGGNAGLPIIKNKLFLYSSYEGRLEKVPESRSYTVPTTLEREGDFSRSLNAVGGLRTIFDPWSTRLDPATGAVVRNAFPGNTIPKTQFDPTARAMLSDVWLPNNPGLSDGSLNFLALAVRPRDYYNISERADWMITPRLRTFARYSRIRTLVNEEDWTGLNSKMAAVYGTNADSDSIAADAVYTLSPSTVLNLRGNYVMMSDNLVNENMKVTQGDLDRLWPGNRYYDPYLKIRAGTPLYYSTINVEAGLFNRDNFWVQVPKMYSVAGKVSTQQGRHYLKVGGEWRYNHTEGIWARMGMMSFSFPRATTADTFLSPNTALRGSGWATFLLGALDSSSFIEAMPLSRPYFQYYSGFLQDDFKLNRRVTLNLGLRWEFEGAVRDPDMRLSRPFDMNDPIPEMQATPPDIPQQARALMNRPYRFNGAWRFTDENNRAQSDAPKLALSPRLGAAVRVNDRTSVRFGFAHFVTPPGLMDTAYLAGIAMPGFDGSTTVAPALQGVPQAALSNPFPASNPLILPSGKSLGRYTNLGGAATWIKGDLQPVVSNRFNLSFQRELPNKFLVDVTHFLNMASNLSYTKQFNLMDPELSYQHKALLSQSVANPFYRYLTPDKFPGQLRNQQRVSLASLLTPFPQYTALNQDRTNGPRMLYNSIQIKVQRPFSHGFNFLLGYNYNRENIEEFFSGDQTFLDQFNWERSSGPRHKLTTAGVFELPFGRGRRFLPAASAVVDALFGGWAFTGYYTYTGGNSLRFGAMQVTGDPVIRNPDKWGVWFNRSVFAVSPAFTRRSNPKWFDDLWGPAMNTLDVTMAKSFRLTERFRAELRMESTNFTNTFNPADPSTAVGTATMGRITNQRGSGRQFQYNLRLRF